MDLDTIIKIAAPVITALVGGVIKVLLEAKPKLVTYLVHTSAIPIKLDSGQTANINGHTIVVRNSGKRTAHNVRIGHSFLPAFQMYPPVSYEENSSPNGTKEIVLPTLVPNEEITVSYLYPPTVTYNQIFLYCKADEMTAKVLNVFPAVRYPPWVYIALNIVLFVGASTIMYWLAHLSVMLSNSIFNAG